MTAPQLPGPSGNVPPHVPATFRPVSPDGHAGGGSWGRELAALTGPASAPPGGLAAPAVTGPRGARRKASPPSRRAADPAWPAVPALVAPPPATAPVPAPVLAPEPDAGADAGTEPSPASDDPRAAPVPALPAGDRERLLSGTHPDPHAHLGPLAMSEGTVRFRTLRPYATSVTVLVPDAGDELRTELLDEGDGFFAGEVTVPAPGEIPAYELLVRYGGGHGRDEDGVRVVDPYGFPPALGELDLRLFGEGRHETLWRALGARTMTHRGVSGTRFTVWAPNARGVRVAGDFNRWDGTAFPMRTLASSGVWELFLPGVGDGALYKFEVVRSDGSRVLHADPMARTAEVPSANTSAVHTSTYRWGDGDWLDRRAAGTPLAAPMSVYEVHLPSWRPGLTYRELAAELPAYVRDSGFTHVELMPCAEHPSGGSWGCPTTGFYAPAARLGGPDGFRFLVDSLHRAGIGVFVDWVPGQFPEDEWALARFDGPSLYEHPGPERDGQPERGTPAFDFARPEVRNFLVACAVHWCEEFHVDGLRVGAVGSMLRPGHAHGADGRTADGSRGGHGNPDAVALLQQMNATVHRRCPGVVTAAEESTGWDGVTRATDHKGESGFGGLGFDLEWNTGWTHDSLGYMRQEPSERARRGEQLTRAMTYAYSENFILPVSHDEVAHGNGRGSLLGRTPGDAWRQRADHRAFLAFMWAHPGKQLLFMGQEFAQGTEWSEERGPDWRLLDPATPGSAGHRGVRDLVRDLNSRYASTPALWQLDTDPAGFRWVEDGSSRPAGSGGDCVFALLRFDASGDPLLSVSNFSPVTVSPYRLGVPHTGGHAGWREVLNTDEARYGGAGAGNPGTLTARAHPAHGYPLSVTPVLPALTTLWFRPA